MADYCLDVLDEAGRVMREVPVTGRVMVGRGSSDFTPDVMIPGECRSASRQHAAIELLGELPTLTDQSRFGTIVNGRVVHHGSVALNAGDEIVFGLPGDGLHIRFHVVGEMGNTTSPADPFELITVSETPRQIRIGRLVVEEHLGDRSFRLLKFLAGNKGRWYPTVDLGSLLWPDPDSSPYQANQALSRCKKQINDLLRPHLKGQDAIESWPHKGYRMKPRLEH